MRILRFIAMKRSGHHAIMNWVCKNSQNVKFINNVSSSSQKEFLNTLDVNTFFAGADLFVYNIEDFTKSKEHYYPTIVEGNFENVLVIRDLYNCMASRLIGSNIPKKGMLELWKEHANLFLNESNLLKIKFNSWFVSKPYRDKIAHNLNLSDADKGLQEVSEEGRGSSFDGLKYNNKAQKMDVLNRYNSFLNNKVFLKYIDDEAIDLNNKIFKTKML